MWKEDQSPRVKKERKPSWRGSSPASHLKAKQTDGEDKSSQGSGSKQESSLDKSEIPCRFKFWLRQKEKPSKKFKKGCAKGSVAMLKESSQLGCVSHDSYPRKSILREPGKLGSRHAVKFSKGTWHQIKIRERKDPSRGIIQKWAPHERRPFRAKIRRKIT